MICNTEDEKDGRDRRAADSDYVRAAPRRQDPVSRAPRHGGASVGGRAGERADAPARGDERPRDPGLSVAGLSRGERPARPASAVESASAPGRALRVDSQTAIFYPLNLPYYFLPTPAAWALSFPLRMFLAGLFAALLARSLGAGSTGATVTAVVFCCCGFLTCFAGWATADTSLWLPLACLAILRLLKAPGPPSIVLAGLAFALPVLAGHAENALHVTLVGTAFFLWNWLLPAREQTTRPRCLVFFVLAGLLAVALAAVQLVPTIEWIGFLRRSIHRAWTAGPLVEILNLVSRDQGGEPNTVGVRIPEGAGYAGMLTLLLAPLALLHRNRRNAVFFTLLVLCCIQVIYGLGPLYWLSRAIPVLRGAANGRLIAVVDFGLAVLAGLGAAAVEERILAAPDVRALRPWWILAGAGLFVSVVGVAILFARFRSPAREPGEEWLGRFLLSFRTPLSSAVLMLLGAWLLVRVFAGRRVRQFGPIAIGLLAADLVTATVRHIPFARARDIFPPAPAFEFLRAHAGFDRVTSVDGAYTSNAEIVYGLSAAGGYDILLRRTARLMALIGPPSNQVYPSSEKILAAPSRLLDLLNVRYLVATTVNEGAARLAARPDRFTPVFSEGAIRIFENRSVLPPAFLLPAGAAEILSDEEQFRRLMDPRFDPAKTLLLADPVPRGDPATDRTGDRRRVLAFSRETNSVRITVDVGEPSFLLLSQTYYPGWRALVDGRRTEVLRADLWAHGGSPAGELPRRVSRFLPVAAPASRGALGSQAGGKNGAPRHIPVEGTVGRVAPVVVVAAE